ncbi:carbohydrate esterase family 16 protein [Xylariaceae sp. FL1019]|nr:carbohydrate esterase family 16 protein [Xylariaceae sp. FL1019]
MTPEWERLPQELAYKMAVASISTGCGIDGLEIVSLVCLEFTNDLHAIRMLVRLSLLFIIAGGIGGSCSNSNKGTPVKNLFVFGDSYSDEGQLSYYTSHNDSAPPPGTVLPTSNDTASGGYTWPYFTSKKLGAKTYNYAVSGAVCSNDIVSRWFPSVTEYQVPTFQADVKYARNTPNTTFFQDRTADNSVYALYVGTNDLGVDGFLRDLQVEGKVITDYIECIWSVFDSIYASGGRRLILFNTAPLETSPLYAAQENGGSGNVNYWTNKTSYDGLEYENKMLEYTTTINTAFDYGAPFELLVKRRWPGASVTIFDVHQIILDIYHTPERYLNSPANATGYYYHCDDLDSNGDSTGLCTTSDDPLSSFLWYDSLHPSERAEEIVASKLVEAIRGDSKYATTYT